MSKQAKVSAVLGAWLVAMLALLGVMIAGLVDGHPQYLALIFFMVIASWMFGQVLENVDRDSGPGDS